MPATSVLNGYVPNGARAYYLQRSQPPVLTLIVHEYYVATGDLDIVKQAMPQLQIAHEWWMLQGPNGRAVQIPNPQVRSWGERRWDQGMRAVVDACHGVRHRRTRLGRTC